MIEIPVYQNISADFEQVIELENQSLTLRIVWNARVEFFFLTVTDKNANVIQAGKINPRVLLLRQHKGFIDDFAGDLIVLKADQNAEPYITYDNFGVGWKFYYLTAAEVQQWEHNNGL